MKYHFPYVSVIVLNYNGKHLLDDCFSSLDKTDYPKDKLEIVMVDNGSTDDSAKYVKRTYPFVKIVSIYPNSGVVGGNNAGVKKVLDSKRVDYVVLLNNDVVVYKNWLIEMVKFAERKNEVSVCGPVVFNTDKSIQSMGGDVDFLGTPHLLKHKKGRTSGEVFFVSSCCILIKRKVIEELEYFLDSSYFAYYDEIDLCWRIRLLGYKIACVYNSKIIHKGSVTTKRSGLYIMFHYKNKIFKPIHLPIPRILHR